MIRINFKLRLSLHIRLSIAHSTNQIFYIQVVFLIIISKLFQLKKKILQFLNLNQMDYLQNNRF
jgi:hypothetical protein